MKLAALYTLFNGTELLESSINQIRNLVDITILGSQEVSNAGNEIHVSDAMNIAQAEGYLKESGHEAFILNYKPDKFSDRKENERKKFTKLIEAARAMGATHFVLLAADHLYQAEQFEAAKARAIELDVDVTLTEMFTYYKRPTWRLNIIEPYWMPFICKIHSSTKAVRQNEYPVRVDPSVRVAPVDTFHTFERTEIMMHHFSMVRHDVQSKFRNAAAGQRWSSGMVERYLYEWLNYDVEKNPGISYFGGAKIEQGPGIFGLSDIFE